MKRTVNKAEFIMSFPVTTPTKDIVARGKEKGIKFSRNYVSRVRLMKRKSAGVVARRVGPRVYPAAPAAPVRGEEGAFKRLVVDLGLARARAMLDEVAALFAGAIAGEASSRRPTRAPAVARSRSRLQRRSPEQIKKALASIVVLLKGKKGGLRSEQIQSALKLSKRELLSPIDMGLASKAIKKKGERRATTYFV